MDLQHRETMRATQAPDVYGGPKCDQIIPRWVGSAAGDKDGEGPIGADISLSARTFPPGTKVQVLEPECPKCGVVPCDMGDMPDGNGGWFTKWSCECDFDWREFALDQFS